MLKYIISLLFFCSILNASHNQENHNIEPLKNNTSHYTFRLDAPSISLERQQLYVSLSPEHTVGDLRSIGTSAKGLFLKIQANVYAGFKEEIVVLDPFCRGSYSLRYIS